MRARKHGRYRRHRSHKPVAVAAALAGQLALAIASGSDAALGLSVIVIIGVIAWYMLRTFVAAARIVKRVLALGFIWLGIALDRQTRQTFRETWEENTGEPLDTMSDVGHS